LKFEGQLTVYNHEGGPCYRCLYPVPPAANTVSSCSESGVLGVIPGIIGTMQAQEAIKVLGGMQGVLNLCSFSQRTKYFHLVRILRDSYFQI